MKLSANICIVIFSLFLCPLLPIGCGKKSENESSAGGSQKSPAETWTDEDSGLMWQVNPPEDFIVWNDAKDYCRDLSIGGFGNWRLPTISELRSLIRGCPGTQSGGSCPVTDNYTGVLEAFKEKCKGCPSKIGSDPMGAYWPPELAGKSLFMWWSSSSVESTGLTWVLNFSTAQIFIMNPPNDFGVLVRCVRES